MPHMPLGPSSSCLVPSEKAIDQKSQHNSSHHHVGPIPLPQKREQREHNSRNRRSNQNQQPELNQPPPVQRRSITSNRRHLLVFRRLALEHAIIPHRSGMTRQVHCSTRKYDQRSQNHASAEHQPHHLINLLIRPH